MQANLNQNRLSQIVTQIKNIGNPMMIPQYRDMVNFVNENGGDPKATFYAKAKEMGVDGDEIVKALRGA